MKSHLLVNTRGTFLLEGGEVAHHHIGAGPAKVLLEGLGVAEQLRVI
jgi:hypothetical protein